MSSIKLNSSGGGSVSLSAASSSTDVTIQFPSGNSSLNQALVASDSSGTLGWSTVPNSTAIPTFSATQVSWNSSTNVNSTPTEALTWSTSTRVHNYDTHSGYDATNNWYVIPQDGYYRTYMCLYPNSPETLGPNTYAYTDLYLVHAPSNNKTSWDYSSGAADVEIHQNTRVILPGLIYGTFSPLFVVEGIFRCNQGDVIKTALAWDQGNDSTNTTTTISGPAGGQVNLYQYTKNKWTVEYVRPL